MPEGDVRILGADTHVSKSRFPWLLGGAAIVTFFALRSRPQGGTPGAALASGANDAAAQTDLEFYRIQQQSASELSQLMASNKLESQAMDYSFRQSQAGQRMCIPTGQYYSLDNATRKTLQNRVTNGQLVETVGPDGICFTPTAAGSTGYMPYSKTSSKSGLFGGSFSSTGPTTATGPGISNTAPQPGIFGLIEAILRAFNQPGF